MPVSAVKTSYLLCQKKIAVRQRKKSEETEGKSDLQRIKQGVFKCLDKINLTFCDGFF